MAEDSNGDSPEPEWLRQHSQKTVNFSLVSSSEDELAGVRHPHLAGDPGHGPTLQKEEHPQARQTPPAQQQLRQQPQRQQLQPDDGAADAGEPAASQLTAPSQSQPATQAPGTQQAPTQPSQATQQQQGVGPKGALPLMMAPDNIKRNKVLLELPPASGGPGSDLGGATDLSGDAGAVGRILVLSAGIRAGADGAGTSSSGGPEMQIDLKGVVYNAWVLPLAGTAMVVNIGPTEAKVESLMNDLVRLREAPNPYGDEEGSEGGSGLAYLMGDDEDHHGEPTDKGADGEAGPPAKKKAAGKKPGAGKAAAKPRKKAKPVAKKAKGKAAAGSSKADGLGVKGGGVKKRSAGNGSKKASPGSAAGKDAKKAGTKKPTTKKRKNAKSSDNESSDSGADSE